MPIASGVIIPQQPKASNELADLLAVEKGVEVSGIGPHGVALVFEADTMNDMTYLTKRIRSRQDVADLQMTYCSWEDIASLE